MIQLIVAAGLAITISAMCSLFEAALYSIPTSRIEVLSRSGKFSGQRLKKLKTDIHRPITAILTLNTVANTTGAAIAGASAAAVFGEHSLGLFSAFFTLAILIFSEILPKTAGVAYNRTVAPVIALPLDWLVKLLAPLVWIVQTIARLIPTQGEELLVSAEEIRATVALSRASGKIDSERHGEKLLTEIMHPVHFVPESAPLNMVLLDFFEKRKHLFVVVDEYGSVTGVISLEDIIEEIVGQEIMDETDKTQDMRELARRKRRILTGK
ncbi:MAG: CNNM domain-containing protein [Deltaproteobacteria bacterium]